MNWDDLRIALAVARHGSLNAAARALGTTQPTISRRLDGFERALGAKLFDRKAGGLSPTALCAALLEPLDRMEAGAQAVERRIAAHDTGLEGRIAVTSLGWFGDDVLAPLLARFAVAHPQVSVDLVNDARRFNLFRGEADVALRVGSFEEEALVQRKVADVAYGLYASSDYLERRGCPDFSEAGAGHLVTSLVESPSEVVHVAWLQAIAPRAHVVLRTNGIQSHVAIAEAGEAMAVLPRVLGDRRSGLRRLEAPLPEPRQPVKVGVHADLRRSPRIRALIDYLVVELRARAGELAPPRAPASPRELAPTRAKRRNRRRG